MKRGWILPRACDEARRVTVAAILATWPAAEIAKAGGFTLRRGAGGGNRTSAATRAASPGDVAAAEAGMRGWGQRPLFMVAPEDEALDAELAARGYAVHDRTVVLGASASALAGADPERAFFGDIRLAAMVDVWAASGIGPGRLAVMDRAPGPKAYLLGRAGDRVAGAGFVAIGEGAAVLHALEVAPAARRQGVGAAMVRAAAAWAAEAGTESLLLAVTRANTGAQALYRQLGFAEVASYHYRRLP
jgi:N-acetylglutamate synthase